MSNDSNQSQRALGKRVIVTGAGTGIGKGIAYEFGREGADVVVHYSHSSGGANETAEAIRQMGRRAVALQADLADIDHIRRFGNEAVEFLGGVDVLINNAGITANMPFLDATPEQFDRLFDVNIRGMFFMTQAVVPAMKAQGKGSIVNFSSVHGYFGKTHHAIYAGTKGAIISFTRALAMELAAMNIQVNTIAPGWVRVENQENVLGKDFDWEAAGALVPAGYVGRGWDMGRLAIFLTSDEGRYIVGQSIVADGGQSSILPMAGAWNEAFKEQYGRNYIPS